LERRRNEIGLRRYFNILPGIGQAADIRDLSAAFNAGRTEGWNIRTSVGVMAAGLAFVPGLGDAVKAGIKPLFGKPATAATVLPAIRFHSTSPQAINPIFEGGFRTDLPNPIIAGRNNRFGRGVYVPTLLQQL
jgi:hypothetical protein